MSARRKPLPGSTTAKTALNWQARMDLPPTAAFGHKDLLDVRRRFAAKVVWRARATSTQPRGNASGANAVAINGSLDR